MSNLLDKIDAVDFVRGEMDPKEYVYFVCNHKSPAEKTIRLSAADASLLIVDLQFKLAQMRNEVILK